MSVSEGGKVNLVLERDVLQSPQPQAPDMRMTVMTTNNIRDIIKDKINNGTIAVHETRQPITDHNLSTVIYHTQEQQKFRVTGAFGMWDASAEKALVTARMQLAQVEEHHIQPLGFQIRPYFTIRIGGVQAGLLVVQLQQTLSQGLAVHLSRGLKQEQVAKHGLHLHQPFGAHCSIPGDMLICPQVLDLCLVLGQSFEYEARIHHGFGEVPGTTLTHGLCLFSKALGQPFLKG